MLNAARVVFAEKGLDAPLEEIAARAGVGIATLYRRFPTREHLIAASFEQKLLDYDAALDEALQCRDPWRGFAHYITRICAMQAADHGISDVLLMSWPRGKRHERKQAAQFRKIEKIVARAQAAGVLRKDFVALDVMLVLMANAGVVGAAGAAAPNMWKRFAAFLLDAFKTGATVRLPPPPKMDAINRVVNRVHFRRTKRNR